MYAATLPSERAASAPIRWSDGAAEIGFDTACGTTRLCHLYQSDPCRVLFPRPPVGAPLEAAIVTTSGGIVGGDRLRIGLAAGEGSRATVSTQAAEKIYRSTGEASTIDVKVELEAGVAFEWMPQETILFDGARLRRTTHIEAASGARLLTGEILVFGRLARGERFANGLLHDGWRVRAGGRLVWADALHLEGDIGATLARSFAFDGAVASATALYLGPDAGALLVAARGALPPGGSCAAAASCLGPLLVVRFLGRDAAALRESYGEFWSAFRHAALGFPESLPRIWHT